MASSPLLRSAGRLLRRPIAQVSVVPRIPRVFLSGVAGGIEPCKVCGYADTWLDKTHPVLSAKYDRIQSLIEKGKRFERERERQKKISYVLLPSVAALWIFGPEKKVKSSPKEELSI